MIRLITALICSLALVCSQASAGFLLNSYAISSVPTIAFLQCETAAPTGSNPYTFSSINTGTASADRRTVVGVVAQDNTTVFTASTLTVGGDSASKQADNGAASAKGGAAIFILDNSSGTSESVVITFSEAVSINTISICLWSITGGLSSNTSVDSATGSLKGSSTQTLSSDFSANGVGVGVCTSDVSGRTWTWTGMTERADGDVTSGSRTAADYTATAAETDRTITAQPNGTGEHGCAVATFR